MSTRSDFELASDLTALRAIYRRGDYNGAAVRADELLRILLFRVHKFYSEKLDLQQHTSILKEMAEQSELTGSVEKYTVSQYAKLFELTGFLNRLAASPLSDPLLQTFALKPLAELLRVCAESDPENDKRLLRLAIQQPLQLCTLLAYRLKIIELTDADFLDDIKIPARDQITKEFEQLGFTETFFLFNPERGLLLNKVDKSRNVAFRAETFSNLLTSIYRETQARLTSLDDGDGSSKVARSILETAGKDCGLRFARALETQFQREASRIPLKTKIAKWCEFDSDVGFGRFSDANLKVDEMTNQVEGAIGLAENFLTVGKGTSDDNICSFLKGYIWGILEELTGLPLRVTHKKQDCAQFQLGGDTCAFRVAVDNDRYRTQLEELKKIDLEAEL